MQSIYLRQDEFDAALILSNSSEPTEYIMSWDDSEIDFEVPERDDETDEEFLDLYDEYLRKALKKYYKSLNYNRYYAVE